ncbi:MAG: tetratricopeptide repeat protein [Bacteroidetes bacterium]|nr:MAG: tetratricopeptide repeat protein [Bacteroidota bacterium]
MSNKKKSNQKSDFKQTNASQKNQSGKKRNSDSSKLIFKQKTEKKETDRKKVLIVIGSALLLIIAGFVLYNGVLKYNLVFCDDNIFVNNFYGFNSDIHNIKTSFEKTVGTTYYRPLLNVSFILDAVRGGMEPYVYHQTNLILHLLGACLVFLLLIKLKYPVLPSFLFGLFLMIHPIITPSAAWISGRNDSMITIFVALSFILFLFYIDANIQWKIILLPLHLVFFAASIFTKEIAFVFPALCISYVFFFRKDKNLFRKRYIIAGIGWLVVGFIWFFMRLKAIENVKNPDEIGLHPILTNLPTLPAMLGKIFLPVKMIALSSFEMFSIVSGIIVILLITFYFIKSKKLDKKKAFFGVLWFALFLLPTFLVRIIYVEDFFDYAEHRAFLPMVGIIIILIEILKDLKVDFKKPAILIPAIAILIALGVRSYVYEQHFENRKTFWSHMTDIYPLKPRGYLDLGKAYFAENDLKTAEKMYLRGIELNPRNKNLYIDVSVIYLRWNQLGKAEQFARKAFSIDPNDPLANYNLGKALQMQAKHAESLKYFENAVLKNPGFPQWYLDIGVAYYHNGLYEKSIESFQKAITMYPNFALAYSNMGASFARLQKEQEAVSSWQKAIELDGKSYDACQNLIRFYFRVGRPDLADIYIKKLEQNGGSLAPDIINFLKTGKIISPVKR